MEGEGFQARFVGRAAPEEIERAIDELLDDPARRAVLVASNRRHLELHEDKTRQMDRLLALCQSVGGRPRA
jgi:hypothetical protein